jgi:hypothetical protein
MQPDAPMLRLSYIYIYRGASGAVLVCIFFSLNARLRSTRPKNLRGRVALVLYIHISFSLNARLGSTRPKNLKAGRQCNIYRGASGAVLVCISFSLNARLRSTRPKNLKAGWQCSTGGRVALCVYILFSRR